MKTARASLTANASYAAIAPSDAPALTASSASATSVPGTPRLMSAGFGGMVSAEPVKMGYSSGPPTYRKPRTAPAKGRGGGFTPSVSRRACASTPET